MPQSDLDEELASLEAQMADETLLQLEPIQVPSRTVAAKPAAVPAVSAVDQLRGAIHASSPRFSHCVLSFFRCTRSACRQACGRKNQEAAARRERDGGPEGWLGLGLSSTFFTNRHSARFFSIFLFARLYRYEISAKFPL